MWRLYPHNSTFELEKSKTTGSHLQLSLLWGRGSAELVEKVGKSNMGLLQ
jgi:hypothetical protein